MPELLSPSQADAALFGDSLALDLTLRLAVQPGPAPAGSFDAAERLLRDLAMIEERRGDEGDASHAPDPALKRLEAKLDLTLQLLSGALPHLAGPAPTLVRIGARGLRVRADPALPLNAVLRWQPSEALPLSVLLPLRRIGAGDDSDWWAFDPLPETFEEALSRHLFRLHRREIATQRRS